MLQASLVNPVAKLDIKDLLEPPSSPPSPRPTQPSHASRSISVPSTETLCNNALSPSSPSTISQYSTSSAPPYAQNHHRRQRSGQLSAQPTTYSTKTHAGYNHRHDFDLAEERVISNKRPLPIEDEPASEPAKRQSKWSPAEDAKIIRLRGKGMKWGDISQQLPGRSDISCRLHYQNYLEKRSEWDEEKRDKLARVYDRLKQEMWTPIASELQVPWRAVEAMHWSMGEHEMARRANVVPFCLSTPNTEPPKPGSGRIAQRDRMLKSNIVFEGQDLSTLGAGFVGVNGGFGGMGPVSSCGVLGRGGDVRIPPIKSEQHAMGIDEGCRMDDGGEDDGEGGRARKARLPGFAELDGEVQAFAGGRVMVKQEQVERGRRSSGGSFVTVNQEHGRRSSGGSYGSE